MKLSLHLVMGLLALLATHQRAVAQPQDDDYEDDLDVDNMDMDEMELDNMGLDDEEVGEAPKLKLKERPVYKAPVPKGNTFFNDAFESVDEFESRWTVSQAKKDDADADIAKYDGKWSVEEATDNPLQGDLGLVLKSRAKHHAVAAKLDKPYEFSGKSLIVQYEVKFQNGQECGGAYIKLLMKDKKTLDLKKFTDKMGYTIMFGPDKCGNDNKLHFIFRHKNPVTGEYEEKHAKKPTSGIDKIFTDKLTHLYTLVVNSDNSFEIYVDQDMVNSGNLLEDMTPPVNPPKEIVDPDDKKPQDWDEREKIADPKASKPEDWDESEPEHISDPDATKPDGWLDDEAELVADPEAEKPTDWDDDMDGEWEAPMINNAACESAPGCGEWYAPEIKNPKYKGKWRPPMIDNPEYKGKWSARMIPNPGYFEDKEPYKMTPFVAVGLELWSMSDNIMFDNFIITDEKEVADVYAADSWELKHFQELAGDGSGRSVVQAVMDATEERPWLWAVILLVVVLPIVLVIAYCCIPSGSKTGFFQSLLDAADERKWLYAVYACVILLPILVLSVWLCPNSGLGVKADDVAAALHKKTDEATPADKEDGGEEEEDGEKEAEEEDKGGAGDSTKSPKKKKASRSDLEAEEEEADAEQDQQAEEESTPQTRSSPRKRKARKD